MIKFLYCDSYRETAKLTKKLAKEYNIGIDIGGTNVKIAIVDNNGKIAFSESASTRAEMGYEFTIKNIINLIKESLTKSEVSIEQVGGIGAGCPGQIDSVNGIVRALPNIPGWVNVPLAEILMKEFDKPVKIDNDVRVATLGEYKFGAGKGYQNLICITVGTGIGSGIIADGKLIRGASLSAGELGHVIVQENSTEICGCGNLGCVEAIASGPAIVKQAELYLMTGKSTKFKEIAAGCSITPEIVAEAALQGDGVAKRIFERTGYWIGIALSSVVNLLNPEVIIVGGGVAQAGDLLLDPIRETISKRALAISAQTVQIIPAQLGNSAGVVGASLLTQS
jgi:glucokinase